jgi:hypothetical protein
MREIILAVALTIGIGLVGTSGAGAVAVNGASLARAVADAAPGEQVRWCRRWHGWRSGWHRRCWW